MYTKSSKVFTILQDQHLQAVQSIPYNDVTPGFSMSLESLSNNLYSGAERRKDTEIFLVKWYY